MKSGIERRISLNRGERVVRERENVRRRSGREKRCGHTDVRRRNNRRNERLVFGKGLQVRSEDENGHRGNGERERERKGGRMRKRNMGGKEGG